MAAQHPHLKAAKARAKAQGLAWGKLSKGQQAAHLAHANPARDQKAAGAKAAKARTRNAYLRAVAAGLSPQAARKLTGLKGTAPKAPKAS